MDIVIGITATLAILGTAVIFGTDVLTAVVLRPSYAEVGDEAMVQLVGRSHHYGDKRLPIAGIGGAVFTGLTAGIAFIAGAWASGILALTALVLLFVWLGIFGRVSAPINKTLTAAAFAGEVPADTRTLQARWDSVIVLRSVLQGAALLLLCAAIVLA
ncbi:DUF1772 domain-containing protein [Microbacterium horticulturae]|uniref:DUF1772 domain-containing protein n=1 Tax=Microbacterium horticulturae TaxID=3028316 RepID=A0ABY8BY41_9MICO|nr:DUF1772 domain-containing protein [Microbacterium sp. KACC 23027]WEG09115.1 DUF1772 domain-containing protein [Microbacterium sp. KACC 23027]